MVTYLIQTTSIAFKGSKEWCWHLVGYKKGESAFTVEVDVYTFS